MRGGLKPILAQRSSNSACKLRAIGVENEIMMKFVARGEGKFKEILSRNKKGVNTGRGAFLKKSAQKTFDFSGP
jgi:hypothetical protein